VVIRIVHTILAVESRASIKGRTIEEIEGYFAINVINGSVVVSRSKEDWERFDNTVCATEVDRDITR
jgi:hypothetical protein